MNRKTFPISASRVCTQDYLSIGTPSSLALAVPECWLSATWSQCSGHCGKTSWSEHFFKKIDFCSSTGCGIEDQGARDLVSGISCLLILRSHTFSLCPQMRKEHWPYSSWLSPHEIGIRGVVDDMRLWRRYLLAHVQMMPKIREEISIYPTM